MGKINSKKTICIFLLSLLSYGCSPTATTNNTGENSNFNVSGFMPPPRPPRPNPVNTNNDRLLLAGLSSTFELTNDPFGQPSNKLSEQDKIKFHKGEDFFDGTWLAATKTSQERDGLGPFFNGASCATCHISDGRGRPPVNGEAMTSMLLRISLPGHGNHNQPVPTKIYGDQLQGFAIDGVKPEAEVSISYQDLPGRFPDGETYTLKKPIYKIFNTNYGPIEKDVLISPRVANQMGGMGLLEDIPERDILAQADPFDRNHDGISGKANYVWDAEHQKFALGRFGWKANQPSIRQQVAGAFNGDIGISSPIFPDQNYSETEEKLLKEENKLNGGNPELEEENLENVTMYSRNLSIPVRRDINNPDVIRGEKLFCQISCNTCHTTTMHSQGEIIHPYTDLLLHDMGRELADNRPDYQADGNEWRTPPLWTIGMFKQVNGHTNYMHDGRANNLTEAILWHGGEAERSRENFKRLPKPQREALIKFLNSL